MEKEKFLKAVNEIAWQGGLMEKEEFQIEGKGFPMIKRAKYHQDGEMILNYDYFNETEFERIVLSQNKEEIFMNTENQYKFNASIYAMYSFYDLIYHKPLIRNEYQLIHKRNQIDWINYVLDEQFTQRSSTDAWEIYELIRDWNLFDKEERIMGRCTYFCGEILSVMKYLYVSKGREVLKGTLANEDFSEEAQDSVRAIDLVLSVSDLIYQIKEGKRISDEEEVEKLLIILQLDKDGKLNVKGSEEEKKFASVSILIPPEILVKAICDEFGMDFWICWDKVKNNNQYQNIWKSLDPASYDMAEKLDTITFLNRSRVLNEKNRGRLKFTEEDLIYCWDKVELDEIKDFLKLIHEKFNSIGENCVSEIKINKVVRDVVDVIKIPMFKEMYLDFKNHENEKSYQTAMHLIENQLNEMQTLKNKGQKMKAKYEIKHTLALFNNIPLRKKILGF